MSRNDALDGLRFMAALAIVSIHVTGTRLGYDGAPVAAFFNASASWAVPFFFLVSGYLHEAGRDRGFIEWTLARARRLLLPYAFWTVVLVALQSAHDPSLLHRFYWPGVVLDGGGFSTLWFLPTLFYCAVATFPLRGVGQLRVALALSIVGVALYLASGSSVLVLGTLLPMLPVYLLGRLAFYVPEWRWSKAAVPIAIITMALLGATEVAMGWPWTPVLILVLDTGVGTFAALWLLSAAVGGGELLAVSRLAWGAPLLIGIYMLHSVFVMLIDNVLPMSVLGPVPWLAIAYAVVAGFAVIGTIVLRRVAVLRAVL